MITFHPYSMRKVEMLHGKWRYFLISDDFCDKMTIFARKSVRDI